MSDNNKEDRDAFFAAMKEMEQHSGNCTNKGKLLENVLTAKEQITFAVIDRCREAVLQLRQCHHVVKAHHERFADTSLGRDNKTRLDELLTVADEANERATQALTAIISWVPAAVNTRALGSVR